MDVQTLTYIIVVASFSLYIGIAIWSKASTTGEFYIQSSCYTINDCTEIESAHTSITATLDWDD